MHIAEGFLPVTHAVGWFAVSTPLSHAPALSSKNEGAPESRLLLAAEAFPSCVDQDAVGDR